MDGECHATHIGIQMFVRNTAGGNTQYKIVHNIIEMYNGSDNTSIGRDLLHKNGIWNEAEVIETRKERLKKVAAGEYVTAKFPRITRTDVTV